MVMAQEHHPQLLPWNTDLEPHLQLHLFNTTPIREARLPLHNLIMAFHLLRRLHRTELHILLTNQQILRLIIRMIIVPPEQLPLSPLRPVEPD